MSSQPPMDHARYGAGFSNDGFSHDEFSGDPRLSNNRPPSNRSVIVLVFAFAGCAFVAGAIGLYVYTRNVQDRRTEQVERLNRPSQYENLAAAFAAEEVNVPPADADAIENLLNNVYQAASTSDFDRARSYIDPEMFLSRMVGSGQIPNFSFADRLVVKRDFDQVTYGPAGYPYLRIVTIEGQAAYTGDANAGDADGGGADGDGPDSAIVYYLTWDDDNNAEEYCCWVAKVEGTWKLADWKASMSRWSAASEYAILWENQGHSGIDAYYEYADLSEKVWQQLEWENLESAEAILERIPFSSIHPDLADEANLVAAFYWSGLDRWEKSKRYADLVDPRTTPGAYYALALYYESQAEYELAIENSLQYLDAVGLSPDCDLILARAYDGLGRHEESAKYALQRLRWFPDEVDSLAGMFDFADEATIAELLSRAEFPVLAAVRFATTYIPTPERLEAISAFIKTQPSSAAAVSFLQGAIHAERYELDLAMEAYEKAVTTEPNAALVAEYTDDYMFNALQVGEAPRAYRICTDKLAAFGEILAYRDDEFGAAKMSDEAFLEILDEHAPAFPDDAWVGYHRATTLIALGRREEGLELLRAGIAAANPLSLHAFRRAYIGEMFADDKAMDVYTAATDKTDTFLDLARLYEANERSEDLRKLIAEHRKTTPGDPWLHYFDATLAVADDDLDAAKTALAQAIFDSESVGHMSAESLRTEVLVANGEWRLAYDQAADREVAFASIVFELQSTSRNDEMQELIDLFRRQHPESTDWMHWQFNLIDERDDIDEQLTALRDVTSGELQVGFWAADLLRAELILKLCKQGRADEAKQLAMEKTEDSARGTLLYHLHGGESSEAEKYLQEYLLEYPFANILSDESLSPLFDNPQFEPLWKRNPVPLANVGGMLGELFYAADQVPSEEELKESLAEIAGHECTLEKADLAPSGWQAYFLQSDQLRVLVTIRDEPFSADEDVYGSEQGRLWSVPRGLLRIEILDHDGGHDDLWWLMEVVRQLDQTCLALLVNSRLIIDPATKIEEIELTDETQVEDLGIESWIETDEVATESDFRVERDRRKKLRELREAFRDQQDGQQFFVRVRVESHAGQELVWLRLREIKEPTRMRTIQFIGELTDELPMLANKLRPGMLVRATGFMIQDWRVSTGVR